MLIWSVMPEEIILEHLEEITAAQLITYHGKQLLVRPQANGNWQVMQIISSNPRDFLEPNISPGSMIKAPIN